MCFFVHHHIACLCNVIIYCKTRVMAKFRCWGLPLNIEYWKQCILTKEFWAWTMIPHCTLVCSLHVSRTFVDFLLLVDKTRSKYCFDQMMLQNTKKGTLISFFDIFLFPLSNEWQVFFICEILFKVSTCILYRRLQSFWTYPLVILCKP